MRVRRRTRFTEDKAVSALEKKPESKIRTKIIMIWTTLDDSKKDHTPLYVIFILHYNIQFFREKVKGMVIRLALLQVLLNNLRKIK